MNRLLSPRTLLALLVLGLIVVFVAGKFSSRALTATAQTGPAAEVAVVSKPAAAKADASAPRELAGLAPQVDEPPHTGPLARAETFAERWLDDPAVSDHPRRVRLVREAGGRALRLVEHFQVDPSGAHLVVLATEVMRADAVLVAVPAGEDAVAFAERLRAAGFATEPVRAPDAVVCLHLPEVTLDAVPEAIAAVAARLPGLVAEPDFIRFPTQTTSNDYDVARSWGLEKIEAPAAWTVSTGSADVVVAVIDTGILTTHPDLAANIWTNTAETPGNGIDDDANGYTDDIHGWNFASNNASITDAAGHGTHVAGTIGAVGDNSAGVVGVNWNVRLMALRAGSDDFTDSALTNALRYAIRMRQRGVRVVAANMSLGGSGYNATLHQEIVAAGQAGILVIAAAGNESSNVDVSGDPQQKLVYPAGYDADAVIAVASSNQGDRLSVFSNYGATSIDLAAPGTQILSTVTADGYARYDGTSMAAPHVAGAVALVAAANPALSALQIRARILDTVDAVPVLAPLVATGGRLNLRRAVSPDLLRPRVVLSAGGDAAEVAVIDRAGIALDLAATVQADGGVTPAASLAWTMEAGPQAVVFSTTTGVATTATFPAVGRYRVRVTATTGALQERDEIVVAVGGDTAASTSGLRAWWKFDDTGASTADASGNGRTGTVVSATRSATAVLGTSMEFNGSNSRVTFDTPALSQLSIAGWARASGANGVTIFPRVVHMREGLLFGGFDTSGGDDGNANTLKFTLDDGTSDQVWHSPPGTFSIGTWFHVAVTFDPTATHPAPVFYINGVRQFTGTQSSVANTSVMPLGTGYVGYGEVQSQGTIYTRPWLGQLDEIRLYNRVLDDAEVVWLSHEPVAQAAAGSALTAGASEDPFTVPLTFADANVSLGATAWLNATWTDVGGVTTFIPTGAISATAAFTEPGEHLVRFDATSSDGVHVTRTLTLDVPATPVTREGYYTGTTSTGGIWTLLVRSDGTGTFFSSGVRGSFQHGFSVSEWGLFTFTDRAGTTVRGRVRADGAVSGTIGDPATFSGVRTTAGNGAADPARDGVYSGWVVDTGVRAAAQVERGLISLVLEESGAHRAATGAIEASGVFLLSPASGASYAGTVGAGRLDATVTVPGIASARRVVLLRDDTDPVRRLTNISVRGVVGAGDAVLIPGFVIEGGELPVLARGIGPGLIPYRVPADSVLQRPRIILRRDQTLVRDNTGWTTGGQTDAIIAANTRTHAFTLDAASPDSALTLPLAAEAYTMEVNGADGGTGIALAEIYDARTSSGAGVGELVNISGRGFVGTGDNILIGGFHVEGDAPVLVLIRAAGPALARFDVDGVLAQPRLRVVRMPAGAELATAASWDAGDTAASIAEAAAQVHAFSFAPGSGDAALLLFLPAGGYTAQVSGAGDTTGVALLEIYRVKGL